MKLKKFIKQLFSKILIKSTYFNLRIKDFFSYLDVFKSEPLKPSSKLWELTNVSITPHVAGVTVIESAIEYMFTKYKIYKKNNKLKSDVESNKHFY